MDAILPLVVWQQQHDLRLLRDLRVSRDLRRCVDHTRTSFFLTVRSEDEVTAEQVGQLLCRSRDVQVLGVLANSTYDMRRMQGARLSSCRSLVLDHADIVLPAVMPRLDNLQVARSSRMLLLSHVAMPRLLSLILTDLVCDSLPEFPVLHTLQLWYVTLHQGLQGARLPRLWSLHLVDTTLGGQGNPFPSELPQVRALMLERCSTPEACVLPTWPSLQHISLSQCPNVSVSVDRQSALCTLAVQPARQWSARLVNLGTLVQVTLTQVREVCITECPMLNTIHITECYRVNFQDAAAYHALQHLQLQDITVHVDLPCTPCLKTLHLQGIVSMALPPGLPHLEDVYLSDCMFLQPLPRELPCLHTLCLDRMEAIETLRPFPQLHTLTLSRLCSLGTLDQAFPQLRTLTVALCGRFSRLGALTLASVKHLTLCELPRLRRLPRQAARVPDLSIKRCPLLPRHWQVA
jgi:hypothetical protein